MARTLEQAAPQPAGPLEGRPSPGQEDYLQAFRSMLMARLLEEKLAGLYRGGKIIGGVYLGKGQEALSAAIGTLLSPGDVFAPLIRDLAGRLAAGEPPIEVVRAYFGSALGQMRGRDGNVHRGRPRQGMLPMISHLGAMVSVVNGVLMARRFQRVQGAVGVASLGDGATSTGAFHEALNQASVEKLPLVLVVANNQYAYSTPLNRQFACRHLVDKAAGYGVEGHTVDGTCLAACLDVLKRAMLHARAGQGPQLVVASLLRLCGHGEHDDAGYVEARLKNSETGRDCLQVSEAFLVEQGWATPETIQTWTAETRQTVEQSVAQTEREPAPDPFQEDWCPLASRHLTDSYNLPDVT